MFKKVGDIVTDSTIFKNLTQEYKDEVCEKHGQYRSERIYFCGELKWASTCPQCRRERYEEAVKENKKYEKEQRIKDRLRYSNIPPEYEDKGFQAFICENENDEKVFNLCNRYVNAWRQKVEPEGYGLLMYGACGTGKTHLSTAILKAIIENDWDFGKYVNVREVIDSIRATWNNYAEPEKKERVLNYYRTVTLLIIDELGVQAGTQNETEILFSILDYRVTHSYPTILISNLNKKDLQALLGERLYDRIISKCVPLQFLGRSKRKRLTANDIPF